MAVEEDSSIVKLGNDELDESSIVDKLDKREMDDINIAHKEGSLGTRAGNALEIQIDSKTEISVDEKINQNKRKNKHTRRGSKKNKPRKPRQKFKPYNTLTWDEKRKLCERDTVKAVRRRKELVLQKGRPIAPYNTTQFLMEEHNVLDNFEGDAISHAQSATKPGYNSSDNIESIENGDSSSSSVSDDEYFDKDFNEFYEKVHIDTLNSYSKEDLIKTVYELENKIEVLEKNAKNSDNQLEEENQRLTNEIKELKERIDGTSSS